MKLYAKILLSFIIVLIITEVLVFGLFMMAAGRLFHTRFEKYTIGKLLVARAFVEEKMRFVPGVSFDRNDDLKKGIEFLGEAYDADIWLEGPRKKSIVKSFSGNIPEKIMKRIRIHAKVIDETILYYSHARHRQYYASIEIGKDGEDKLILHMLFKIKKAESHGKYFALGLFLIGVVVAFLIIPVSKRITGPLKDLRKSAIKIAGGELSHRADISGKDEIGDLGCSFNAMADKLERMILSGRELTANVSHELRSPLARINVAIELLNEYHINSNNKNAVERIEGIRNEIKEIDCLIGRILELSRLDIQEKPIRPENLDPVLLITDLLDRFRPSIEFKRIHLETRLSFDPPFSGDKEALRDALANILDNAVKFTPEQGDIIVETSSEKKGLKISVTNTSKVIGDRDLSKIFEPFYRIGNSNTAGSGLGLAMAKKIVNHHGGSIKAFNSEKGLTFKIVLYSIEK